MRFQHVALETRREHVQAEIRFWALLGLAEVRPPETLADRTVWLNGDGAQIHLMFEQDALPPPVGHVAFVIEDYDAAVRRLRDAGFEVEDREEHWGSPRCFVFSPAGHRVELMAAPPD